MSGEVEVTPEKTGYEFEPSSRIVNKSASNIDFSANMLGELVVVQLELLDIPSTLPFNQDFVADHDLEYWWGINIDVDNNPDTGSYGHDVMIALAHWKEPDSSPTYSSVIEGTQHDTWVYTGDHFTRGHEIDVAINYTSNILTLIGLKSWEELSDLNENSRFNFDTHYCAPDGATGDDTNDAQGSEVIDDPMGDVSYSFVDIIHGSLLI